MTQSFWLFGSRLTILADRTTTDGKYDLIEGYFPPGTQTPPHRHTRYSEQLYVLEGEFTVWAEENKVVLKAGESFLIPMGTTHVVAALSDQPARGLVVASPSAFAHLIEATGTLNEIEEADLALFMRVSTEIGDEILGVPGDLP
ncbi:MAG: cupin domain-containing protein [Rhizonema sp. NSF051]|nr:cupin domain-containing protein [Rhizonema sp. NSF051]